MVYGVKDSRDQVDRDKKAEVGYFVGEEGSKAISN